MVVLYSGRTTQSSELCSAALLSLGLPSTSFDIPASSNPSSKFRAQVPAISCFTGDRDYIAISGFPIWFGVILTIKKKHYPHTPSFKSEMRFLPTFVGEVTGPFSTSITISSQFSLALFTIYTAPCVLFCTIFILKKLEVLTLHQTKEQSERYCDLWKESFSSNRVFWHLSWKTLISLKRQPQQVLWEVGGSLQLLRRRSSPADVQKLKCLFPFPCIFLLKSTVRNLLFYILFNLYKSAIPTEHDKISYQEA